MADAVKQAIFQSPPGSGSLPGGGTYELWQVFDAELVNGTATVDSVVHTGNSVLGFHVAEKHYFGLWINATSATGTADVTVSLLESYNDTAANYAALSTGGTITAALGETATVYTVTPVPMPRMRIRVVGNAANPTDTVVTAFLWLQG